MNASATVEDKTRHGSRRKATCNHDLWEEYQISAEPHNAQRWASQLRLRQQQQLQAGVHANPRGRRVPDGHHLRRGHSRYRPLLLIYARRPGATTFQIVTCDPEALSHVGCREPRLGLHFLSPNDHADARGAYRCAIVDCRHASRIPWGSATLHFVLQSLENRDISSESRMSSCVLFSSRTRRRGEHHMCSTSEDIRVMFCVEGQPVHVTFSQR